MCFNVKKSKLLAIKGMQLADLHSCLFAFKKGCLIVLLSLACSACTNSKLVLRPLYNSLDNRIEERFLEYATFNSEQTQQIQALFDHFHVWHRQSQLQYYSALLDEVTGHLKETRNVSEADIQRWSEALNTYRSSLITCNPFYASADIVASLSDQQIIQIREKRLEQRESRRQRRIQEDERAQEDEKEGEEILAESVNGRIKQTRRFLNFIDITLTKEQLDDLGETMSSTIRPKTSFTKIRDQLDSEFYTLLQKRKNADFKNLLANFLDKRQQTIFDWRKQSREHNRTVWEAYALRTVRSLDDTQRNAATNYLKGLISTINDLAADEPSYRERTASEYECFGKKIAL